MGMCTTAQCSRVRGGGVGISACRPFCAVPCRAAYGGGGQRGLVPSRDYVWCLVCSRVRGGGGSRNLRVPPRFVPCRAVPPGGGGAKRPCATERLLHPHVSCRACVWNPRLVLSESPGWAKVLLLYSHCMTIPKCIALPSTISEVDTLCLWTGYCTEGPVKNVFASADESFKLEQWIRQIGESMHETMQRPKAPEN